MVQQSALATDAELRVVLIDQLAQFTGVRATEIFFELLQLHLELADLLEQLSLLGLALLFVLALAAPYEQLAGTIKELPLPLAHLDPPLPAKLTPLHFDHQGGLMEQSNASLQRGRQS